MSYLCSDLLICLLHNKLDAIKICWKKQQEKVNKEMHPLPLQKTTAATIYMCHNIFYLSNLNVKCRKTFTQYSYNLKSYWFLAFDKTFLVFFASIYWVSSASAKSKERSWFKDFVFIDASGRCCVYSSTICAVHVLIFIMLHVKFSLGNLKQGNWWKMHMLVLNSFDNQIA